MKIVECLPFGGLQIFKNKDLYEISVLLKNF